MSMTLLNRSLMGAAVCLLAPALAGAAEPNAALSYWKAFHFMPRMNQNEIKVVSEWKTAKLEDLPPFVEGTPAWLTFLHRGAKIKECNWGQDYDEDGIHHLLPHLDKGRMMTRLALAKARYRFEQADTEGGVEDVLAVLALARHLGRRRGHHLVPGATRQRAGRHRVDREAPAGPERAATKAAGGRAGRPPEGRLARRGHAPGEEPDDDMVSSQAGVDEVGRAGGVEGEGDEGAGGGLLRRRQGAQASRSRSCSAATETAWRS